MCICLDYLDSPVSGSVAECVDSMVLSYGSLASMVCAHLTGDIVGVVLLENFMSSPESAIAEFFYWWNVFKYHTYNLYNHYRPIIFGS